MKFKKLTAAAVAAAMLAMSAPLAVTLNNALSVTANAEETEVETLTEGDWEYKVNEDGETVTLSKYNGTDAEVAIPATLGGKSVTSIGGAAFYDCTRLTLVTIPNSVTEIGVAAFYNCAGLTSVTIPNSVTEIGEAAFYGCTSLKSVTIPNSVTEIEVRAFCGCTGLTSVTIPTSVTSIGSWAFCDCTSITSITIPNSVTEIGRYAFLDCTALTEINVNANNKEYCSVNGILFNKDKSNLVQYPTGKTEKSYTIPNSVTSIDYGAFHGCTSLKSVTIPNSVTEIGGYVFEGCTGLTSVTIPNSVTSIGNGAFGGFTSLTSVTIPSSVTEIGDYAFDGCTGLTSVTIPSSVTSIGYSAFNNCTSLTSVIYNGTKAEWNAIEIGAYDECLTNAEIICTDGIINEREPETSEPTSSETSEPTTSEPTESTLTPGGSDNNTTTTEPTVFKPVLDSSTESLDEDAQTVLSDITVTDSNGAFEDGVVMNVKFTGKTANTFSFDITFTKDGKEVQPNGKVTVKVPVPEFLKNGDIYVYHYDENGKATLVPSKVENGFVIFDADHFSKFELSNKKIATESGNSGNDQANTGIALAAAPVVIACAAVIAASKKRK